LLASGNDKTKAIGAMKDTNQHAVVKKGIRNRGPMTTSISLAQQFSGIN